MILPISDNLIILDLSHISIGVSNDQFFLLKLNGMGGLEPSQRTSTSIVMHGSIL